MLNVLIVIGWLQIPKPQGTIASMMCKGTIVKYLNFSKFHNKSTWGDVCVMSMLFEVCVFPILHVRFMDVFVYVSLCQFLHVLMF